MALFVFVMLLPVMADSEPVNGEAGLKKLLSDIGITSAGDNATAISKAKEFVISRQAQKKRDLVFKAPAAFEEINQKYLTINYDVEIKPGTAGVVSLLFERSGDKIVFAEGKYLLWVGPDDMKEYKSISTEKVCDYYRKLGANDCFPVVTHSKLTRSFALKADAKHNHSGEDINSGIIKEQYIDDAIARDSEVKALIANMAAKTPPPAPPAPAPAPAANINVPAPKPGAVFVPNPSASPNEKIAYLEAEVKRLSELLKDVTRSNETMVFNNMNVQIVNGTGSTESANGRGNLIVGYNAGAGSKSGSHNVVVGSKNSYSSYGGVIAGNGNTASGKFTSVIGGASNTAQGDYSTVVGGEKNNASGSFAIIAGGAQRSATSINPHFSNQ
jgi:hypothetical protein